MRAWISNSLFRMILLPGITHTSWHVSFGLLPRFSFIQFVGVHAIPFQWYPFDLVNTRITLPSLAIKYINGRCRISLFSGRGYNWNVCDFLKLLSGAHDSFLSCSVSLCQLQIHAAVHYMSNLQSHQSVNFDYESFQFLIFRDKIPRHSTSNPWNIDDNISY